MSSDPIDCVIHIQSVLSEVRLAVGPLGEIEHHWHVGNGREEGLGGLLWFTIQIQFQRPDTNTGLMGWGKGREWFFRGMPTDDQLVKTAFLAWEQLLKHELMEAFRYQGKRPFNPHHNVKDLSSL